MRARLRTAGQEVEVSCREGWAARLLEEACTGELRPAVAGSPEPTLRLTLENGQSAFHAPDWQVVTRGAWRRDGEVVLADACSTGFDLALRPDGDRLDVRARWRPSARSRFARTALPSRFHLLVRCALLQYPVLWWAGVQGLAPLHVSAVQVGDEALLLAGPGGVGKSTLVAGAVANGSSCASDNLCVTDGTRVYGLTEPVRNELASGRRMPHGRREGPLSGRVPWLDASGVLVLGLADEPTRLDSMTPEAVSRALVTGTVMAGELRRYWAFAATLAAALELGPAHPEVERVAAVLARRLPGRRLQRARGDFRPLAELLPALSPEASAVANMASAATPEPSTPPTLLETA